MGGRLACFVSLLALAGGASFGQEVAPPTQPKCRDYGPAPIPRICTELDSNALRGAGHSTVWTIRVEGGSNRSEVRLHNRSPAVVRLEGGNDQIVKVVRGGEVQRKVTSISTVPGTAGLDATPYSSSPEREATFLAVALISPLEHAETEFVKRRERLSKSSYPVEAIGRLLDTTESELLDALSYPELAALRGYVQVKFREARNGLSRVRMAASNAETHPTSRVIPALWTGAPYIKIRVAGPPPTAGGKLQKEGTESVLAQILRTIHRLLETVRTHDLYTRLCIVSAPGDGARFMMRPQISDVSEKMEINTNGELQAYRGLYVFSIRQGFRQRINCEKLDREDCVVIDLVDDPTPIFHCDFGKRNCERRPGPVPVGVCHGNGP